MFENRVLRRISGRKRKEVTGYWRKLHELYNCYSSSDVIRMIRSRRTRWAENVIRMENAYRILVGKHEGKKPRGRRRHKGYDNIKLDLK
jgi:hypothetical protein